MRQTEKIIIKCTVCGDRFEHYTSNPTLTRQRMKFCEYCQTKRDLEANRRCKNGK